MVDNFEDIVAFLLIKIRIDLASFSIRVEMRMFSLSEHGKVVILLPFLLRQHPNLAIIVDLLQSLDEIVELGWKVELIRFVFLAEEEQQHDCF